MDNAKRASMREGPLAALFRKTEESDEPPAGSPSQGQPAAPAPAGAPADAPPPPRAREGGPPHPALSAPQSFVEREEVHVPTPRERLRHAFSSEIPDNVMERPGAGPVMDDYAREYRAQRAVTPAGSPVIRVVGVGGSGVNAVNRMVEAEVEGIEFLAVNTDVQSLQQSTADITLHIGAGLTRGLGSGSDARIGRQAAMEDYDRIKALLKGSDMIFIAAGAGGGTGTGAAPIIARISREVGALTVAIVT